MRPIANFAIHALAAALLAAIAASSAAAGPFLKLGSVDGDSARTQKEKWIEIQGWQWGTSQEGNGTVDALTDGLLIVRNSAPPDSGSEKYGAVGGMHRDESVSEKLTVGGGRTETSGQATGKPVLSQAEGRQHKPVLSEVEGPLRMRAYADQAAPLDRGSVRVKVKFPWIGCAVGAHYPEITLGDGATGQRLQDVTVASCGSEGPEESITFVYGKLGAKTQVRGWDPDKKEQ